MNRVVPAIIAVSAVSAASSLPSLKPTPPPDFISLVDNGSKASIPTNLTGKSNLAKRMTSIGRLAHTTSTISNPSIVTFVMHLSHSPADPLTSTAFANTFQKNIINNPARYGRFSSNLCPNTLSFLPIPSFEASKAITQTVHPVCGTGSTKAIISTMLTNSSLPTPQSTTKGIPWSAAVSSGKLGEAGIIDGRGMEAVRERDPTCTNESVVFFNASHAIADGVSMGAVFADLCDERDEIQQKISLKVAAHRRKSRKLSALQRLLKFFSSLFGFARGLVTLTKQQVYLLFSSPLNPFLALMKPDCTSRSIGWVSAGSVSDASLISKHFKITINDLFVACVAKAIRRLAEAHCLSGALRRDIIPETIKIGMPVHLYGGVLLPKQEIGNKIGAVTIEVPTAGLEELGGVKRALEVVKKTNAPVVSYAAAKVVSCLPAFVARMILGIATRGTVVCVSNVRGPEEALHVDGRTVESVVGFVPPPPGVPIGIVVQSYAGGVSLTCNADKNVVPDSDKFLGYVLEEYLRVGEKYNAEIGR